MVSGLGFRINRFWVLGLGSKVEALCQKPRSIRGFPKIGDPNIVP